MPNVPTNAEMQTALKDNGSFPEDAAAAAVWYKDVVVSKLSEIRNGAFARAVLERLPQWQSEYSERFLLLTDPQPKELDFQTKPFESVINKLYRSTVLKNEVPDQKFVDCFSKFDDLIRTTLASPYGDGPKFLAAKFKALGDELKLICGFVERADDFGYYAIHFTFETQVPILSFDRAGVVDVGLLAEIQLTTQLQLSLRTLTHKLYEVRRLTNEPARDWKWDFQNELFRPSYTGHTLHLLESLLLEMKDGVERTNDN